MCQKKGAGILNKKKRSILYYAGIFIFGVISIAGSFLLQAAGGLVVQEFEILRNHLINIQPVTRVVNWQALPYFLISLAILPGLICFYKALKLKEQKDAQPDEVGLP